MFGLFSMPYSNKIILSKYSNGSVKMVCGKFLDSGFDLPKRDKTSFKNYDEKLKNSLSRSRRLIFDYALNNNFVYFCTFTLDSSKYDRDNLSLFIKDFSQFIRNQRKKYKGYSFKYLFIPELHSDNKSWHLHGLFSDLPNDFICRFNSSDKLPYYILNNIDNLYYIPSYQKKFGYCCLEPIKDIRKCASYITKYVSKNLGEGISKSKNVFFHSVGLSLPDKEIISLDIPLSNIDYDFKNDFLCIKWFDSYNDFEQWYYSELCEV